MNNKNKPKRKYKTKKLQILSIAVISFAMFAVFGLSLITGSQQQSNVGTSSASSQEPADINSDNTVDIVDLSILLSNWNAISGLSDINNDNIIDIVDLSILLSKWGSVDTSTTVPMPTRDNTGPRYALNSLTPEQFFSSGTCNRQRINGTLAFDQAWMKRQIFNITDCEITGSIYVYLIGGDNQLPSEDMPTINLVYSDVLGGIAGENALKLNVDYSYIGAKVQLKLTDGWPIHTPGYAPYVFTNSLIYNEYAIQPTHTETLQTAGYGTGTSFTNVVFMQQGGPIANTGVTAAINYVGDGTIFDGCYFLWDGAAPAWYTAYISGPNIVVKNSWFDSASGGGGYVYPNTPSIMPTFINNHNYRTNEPISLP